MEGDMCRSGLITALKHPQPPPLEPKSSLGLRRGLCVGWSWLEVGGGHPASLGVQKRIAELAGAGLCHPRTAEHTECQEGRWEQLSRAQMLTLLPSCGKWKDPSEFPGLRAEVSAGKSKTQDQFLTCTPHLLLSSSLWYRPSNSMGDATILSAKPRAEIVRHVLW